MKLNDVNILISEKLDGISIELKYENGKLVNAITRGDGLIGEDIHNNVVRMQNVKTEIPNFTGSLRGEIILKNKDFESINLVLDTLNEKKFSNPRNAASGISRNYDGRFSEYLTILYYNVITNIEFHNYKDKFEYIENELRLETCPHYFGNIETAKIVYNEYEAERRANLNYDIDGLVISLNDLNLIEKLGLVNNNPVGHIAWKFTSIKMETEIINVEWGIGKSGRYTPVAILEPINIGGVTVSRASLHNIEIFESLNLHTNDKVIIARRNDVIPYVEENLSLNSNTRGEKFEIPTNCLLCDKELLMDGPYLTCKNPNCEGNKVGNLEKWIKSLDLKGIAVATIYSLYDNELIDSPADFYRLTEESISKLDGFGKRSAQIIVETLNSKKELSLAELIGGLNIPNVSNKIIELLENNGYDLVKLMNAKTNELESIKGIGTITANEIVRGIDRKKEIIFDLLHVGVTIKERQEISSSDHPFAGKKVVFTGALNLKRKDAQDMVKSVGGICPDSISKDTDYLVISDPNSTSSKAEKARKFGTKLISEQQFMDMIK